MNKISNVKYQLISVIFFVIYFIGLFPSWFSSEGVKSINGTLILSALFPLGILSAVLFVLFNIITVLGINKLYLHIISVLSLIILISLSIKLLVNWGGFSEFLSLWFYISNSALILSLIFYVAHLFNTYKTIDR